MAVDNAPRLHVEFFVEPRQDMVETRNQGRPIYKDVEYVRIRFPGDTKRVLVAPANDKSVRDPETNRWLTYADRFPRHYELFKKGQQDQMLGTPLHLMPWMTASRVAELKSQHIYTVEQLAAIPDGSLRNVGMHARSERDKAVEYLKDAEGRAAADRFEAENQKLRSMIEELQAKVAGMANSQPAEEFERAEGPGADFESWDDETLKAYLKDITGQTPRGNPSHNTLVRMAHEATVEKQKKVA